MNIGETGNLRQRIAGGAAHSPAQAIAADIAGKRLPDKLKAVWIRTKNGDEALQLKRALTTLFVREFNVRPAYNRMGGNTANADVFSPEYDALKQHITAL